MKILVIAPEPFFTPRGTPFSVYYRAQVASQLGHSIDLLTYGQGLDVNIPGSRLLRIPKFKCFGNIKVGPSLFKLFLDGFLILYTIKLLLTNKYQVVHAHEEAVFFCRFLKPLFRFKLIYDMHSSLPQQLTNFEFTKSKLLIGTFKALENSCLRKADAIITICPDLANYVNTLLDNPAKHFLIENSIFDPINLANATDEQQVTEGSDTNLPSPFKYIVYAGTLEPYQGIDILLPAFKIFVSERPNYRLLIVGGSKKQVEKYSQLAFTYGIADLCTFTGQVSQNLAKRYCSIASIVVSPRKNGTNTPLKVYEQLASGIPLVATRIYSHTQVLDDGVAFLVEPTPEDMARGMLKACGDRGSAKARQAQNLYAEKYSRDVYTKKMNRLFNHLECYERN